MPARRSRPISFEVPAGVTVYEFDPERGVRIFRQGGGFWDIGLIPQGRWVWLYRTPGAAQKRVDGIDRDDVQHSFLRFDRAREVVPQGRHPLEFAACRKYLYGQLEAAVADELERRFPKQDPEGELEESE